MTPWLDDGDVRLYHGDALEQLAAMPSESVQMIVTSPPFWGLRDYGTGSWVGGDEGCDHARPPGGGRTKGSGLVGTGNREGYGPDGQFSGTCGKCGAIRVDNQIGLEETPDEWCAKLVGVMREARRVLRSDGVCWIEVGDTYTSGMFTRQGKPRNVPQAPNGYADQDWTTDRAEAMSAHQFGDLGDLKPKDLVGAPWLLAFALRADGWFLRSDTIWARPNPMPESVTDRPTKAHSYVFLLTKSARYFFDSDAIREKHVEPDRLQRNGGAGYSLSQTERLGRGKVNAPDGEPGYNPAGRNARSVWSIATEPTPFAHFATFPQALVERCIKSGSAEGDTVLDPFMGSGTTALVARRLGRHAIGIELNADYLSIAATRLQQLSLLGEVPA